MVVTVLGELVVPDEKPVWTAALLYVLTGLGVSEQAARQAIARASDTGWIASERFGREVRWSAKLLDTYESMDPEPGDDLLFSYLALVDEWRKFPAMDPQLPRDVLPDWIGRRAADTFVSLRARWAPAARERWAEVVRFTAPSQGAPAWPAGRPAGSTPAGPSSSP
jgi:DNA-binding transcriptional regulator PaaX